LTPPPVPAVLGRIGAAAAQQRPDASEELGQFERFGHVVVRAGVEADDGVHFVCARSEHEHREAQAV
jgi:hypothetical protein